MHWWLDWEDPKLWFNAYVLFEWAVRLTMLAIVPMRRTPDAAKGWLLFIFFMPVLGLLAYMMFGSTKLPTWRVEQFAKFPGVFQHVRDRLRQDRAVMLQPEVDPGFKHAVNLAFQLGHLPILGGNSGELLVEYDQSIEKLAQDIDAAQHHVHLLYYIVADDDTTARIIDALGRAVGRGVECRVLIDTVGSRAPARTLVPKLEKLGVQIVRMLPVGLLRRKAGRYDLRNHRKIAVIDARIGYTGSQNLVAAKYKEGITYEEMVIRVTGPIVLELQYLFVADWFVETGAVLDAESYLPSPEVTGTMPMQVLPSGPGYELENVQRLVVSMIHAARERVVITTPYFIPDEPLLQAMQVAVLRGVKVELVLSEKEDQILVSLAQKSYYDELLEAGVQIHLYRKKFLHAKHFSVDDTVAVIGSSNMDIRSFSLNSEVMLMVYDPGLAAQLRAEQDRYHKNCRQLTHAEWASRSWIRKFPENLARLVSPLL
ncbi:MAG: cardiolipin synthase [Gemmataceae bacterium]